MKSLCFYWCGRGGGNENANEILLSNNKTSRSLSLTFNRLFLRQTIRLSFRNKRPKLNNSNVPFRFTALARFKARLLHSRLFLLCLCCKQVRHKFKTHHMVVPEAGRMFLLPRLAHLVPLINSQKLFTITLRLQHHHWAIQQVHSDNRRYGHEFLPPQWKKKGKTFQRRTVWVWL